MREIDSEFEPLKRCQGEATTNAARIRRITGCQRDLWLETAGAHEFGHGAESRIHLSPFDARDGVLCESGTPPKGQVEPPSWV